MDELQFELPSQRQWLEQFAPALAGSWDQDERMDAPVFLVVEDDWVLRQSIVEQLAAAGWAVAEAESGETAISLLESGEPIDVLITDVRLSGELDGWDVAEAFRASNPEIRVVYVSGNPLIEARRVANSIFLPKPCNLEKLVEACRTLI